MRTVEKDVFEFSELSEQAKEKARAWYREGALDYDWYDCIFEDAKTIGELFGLYIDKIYFSGFWSQGDGASFTGSYKYRKGAAAAVKAYAPQDTELHRIAAELQKIQARQFYKLEATISSGRSRYCHENSVDIEVAHADSIYRDIGDTGEALADTLRDYMRWIYRQLEKEYDWLNSDEQVDESILANGYEFNEDGSIY